MNQRPSMVGWYDPGQLARTAVDVLVSTTFGRHSDKRLLEALTSQTPPEYSYQDSDEIWIDYVADTGDGWNPTYAVAAAVGATELEVADRGGKPLRLPRGRLLILGGDEVYPIADRENYRRRLLEPFEAAFPMSEEPHPEVFAIPGNHDWYDSLVSFTRLFCSTGEDRSRWLGGWKTRQSRSYFALRLPGRWWLLGTDVQLGADLDEAQVAFFRGVASRMGTEDRVILCNAVPEWIYQAKYGKWSSEYDASNLRFLEEKVLGNRVAVVIAGDSHYYRRYSTDGDGKQRIVAGGGGAFTHPTHDLPDSDLPGSFVHRASFPSAPESRRYCWRNLLFPFLNRTFGSLTGAIYFVSAWTLLPKSLIDTGAPVSGLLSDVVSHLGGGPGPLVWLFLVLGGFILFTDTHSIRYRLIAGLLHGILHVSAACCAGWAVCLAITPGAAVTPEASVVRGVLVMAGTLAAGWLLGGLIMGGYLLISLNVFGRHANEAFSSLQCQDWKCFLRMRVGGDGTFTIYPIGLRRVPRRWKEVNGPPRLAGIDARATPPALIESPIEVH